MFPKTPRGELTGGAVLLILTILLTFSLPEVILLIAHRVNFWLWFALQTVFSYQIISARSLQKAGESVCRELERGDIEQARYRVSMFVGRDTDSLSEDAVACAAIETVAENTTDGVVSPLFYLLLGGAQLGFLFKAVSTLDSMVGYKNDSYLYFGRFSARADDVLGFIPARIAGLLMIVAALFTGLNFKNAVAMYRRDRKNSPSPNSGQTESVCAGALGVRLGGGAHYFGVYHDKPTMGDAVKNVEYTDIRRANKLMYITGVLALILFGALRLCLEMLL
jgi:adenosylcobinamide-phosphate synthase